MGGTMRLGAYPCHLVEGTLAAKAYKPEEISERHRHRYEFNNAFRERIGGQGHGLQRAKPRRRASWRSWN